MSGRDIRRLVAGASVFPIAEKVNTVARVLAGCGALGIERALVSVDLSGISAGLVRAIDTRRAGVDPPWPAVEFLADDPITGTAADTTAAVGRMVDAGVGAIVCLGGDGTARLAAAGAGDIPLLALSTGTNNVFPVTAEGTVAGLAVGLIASGTVPFEDTTDRARLLEVSTDGQRESAVVDVAVTTAAHVGARALWDPALVVELFCSFAEPGAVGLSSIAARVCPTPRTAGHGVHVSLASPGREATEIVEAPIAPGLVREVGIASWRRVEVSTPIDVRAAGALALDGEREIVLGAGGRARVVLRDQGPRCIDIGRTLAHPAARDRLRRTVPGIGDAEDGENGKDRAG
jgi:predicted polyphosphate/ATP-dependent NAD kinase